MFSALLIERGQAPHELLSVSSEHSGRLLEPDARISFIECLEFMRFATKCGFQGIPSELGRRLHLWNFAAPGFAVLTSTTLEQALETIVRFAAILNVKFPVQHLSRNELELELPSHVVGKAAEVQLFMLDVVKLVTFLTDLLGPKFAPSSLWISGNLIGIRDLEQTVTSLQENDPECRIVARVELPRELLTQPLPQGNSELHGRALEQCRSLLIRLRASRDIRSVVYSKMRHMIESESVPTLPNLAADLGMSERTLRRRLEYLGTSYSQIRDEVLGFIATKLLACPEQTNEGVAERLGYSDAANFRHAFKRWHGAPPSCLRQKLS